MRIKRIPEAPDFSKLSAVQREQHETFFKQTKKDSIKDYACGASLTGLVALAEDVIFGLNLCNPICKTYPADNDQINNPANTIPARQWQIDYISLVKKRVAKAIEQKESYYKNNWLGIITKFFLKCFFLWNNGFTSAITKAEDLLFFWDSRIPVVRSNKNSDKYSIRDFFFYTPVRWVQEQLDTSTFFNYDSARKIEVMGPLSGQRTVDDRTGTPIQPVLPSNFVKV